MILRIAYLRDSAYELDYHTRIGRRVGVTAEVFERVRAGAQAPSWNDRQRTLLAVEALAHDGDFDDATWARLAEHNDPRQLIEIVLRFGGRLPYPARGSGDDDAEGLGMVSLQHGSSCQPHGSRCSRRTHAIPAERVLKQARSISCA